MTGVDVRESDLLDITVRNVIKEDWDFINDIRKRRGFTWREFFHQLKVREHAFINIMNMPDEDNTDMEGQNFSTVLTFLPLWIKNLSENLPVIKKNRDVSALLCKKIVCPRKKDVCGMIRKGTEKAAISEKYGYTLGTIDMIANNPWVISADVCIGCPDFGPPKKPAIIIGNGPSLFSNNHLDTLVEAIDDGFECDVFCVTRTLKPALEAGVVPKYIACADGQIEESEFLDHDIIRDHADKIIAIMATTVHPKVVDLWKGRMFFFTQHIDDITMPNVAHIMWMLSHCLVLNTCGNVGSALWNFVAYLNYKLVCMIGMDLSWHNMEELKEYYPNRPEKWEQAKRGYNPFFHKTYYIDNVFANYREAHLSWLKSLEGIQTINCTEGGALHSRYVESMYFKDFLDGKYERL